MTHLNVCVSVTVCVCVCVSYCDGEGELNKKFRHFCICSVLFISSRRGLLLALPLIVVT